MDTPKPAKPNFLRTFFTKNFIDLRDLPLSMKILTIAGYLAVLGQLLSILVIERFGSNLPMVEYTLAQSTNRVPLVVTAITGLAFIMGWAFLLAGAAAAKARIFLPTLVLLALQLFMVSSLLGIVLDLAFFFVVLVIYAFTFRTNFWRDLPGLHFFGWLSAISVIVFLSIGTVATNAEVASALSVNFGMVMLLTLMFWVLLGLSIFDLGIRIGRFFTRLTRKHLPYSSLNALVVFLLLIHPAVAFLVVWLSRDPFWSFDLPFSIVFLVVALVVWISRHWSASSAAVFLALTLATPVVMFTLSGAFAGRDFMENVLKWTGLFPPTLLFVGMTTYNLLSMGVSFSRTDGKVMPKRARVLLYFGTLILVVACMLFISNERSVSTGELALDFQKFINTLVALSAFVLAIPYIIWMIWKRRELLIGPDSDFTTPPRWAWLERLPARVWLVISVVLACSGICVLTTILLILAWPQYASP